jgi:hypothetical protein
VPGICVAFILMWLVYKVASWSPEFSVGSITSIPPALFLIVAVLLVPMAFRLGQYYRGFMHARGIWHSHQAGISGGGSGILLPLIIAVIVIAVLAS